MDKSHLVKTGFGSFAQQYAEKFKDQEIYRDLFDSFLDGIMEESPKILDLGCGPGNITKALLNINSKLQIIGVDLAPEMIQEAKKANPTSTFFIADALEFLKTNELEFSGIVSGFITPYLDKNQVLEMLKLCAKSLQPKGMLYLSTMEGNYEDSGLQGPSSGKGPKIFVHYFSEGFLFSTLQSFGFEIVKTERKLYQFSETQTNTDLILVAKKL